MINFAIMAYTPTPRILFVESRHGLIPGDQQKTQPAGQANNIEGWLLPNLHFIYIYLLCGCLYRYILLLITTIILLLNRIHHTHKYDQDHDI